jgi:hypothetical protein
MARSRQQSGLAAPEEPEIRRSPRKTKPTSLGPNEVSPVKASPSKAARRAVSKTKSPTKVVKTAEETVSRVADSVKDSSKRVVSIAAKETGVEKASGKKRKADDMAEDEKDKASGASKRQRKLETVEAELDRMERLNRAYLSLVVLLTIAHALPYIIG